MDDHENIVSLYEQAIRQRAAGQIDETVETLGRAVRLAGEIAQPQRLAVLLQQAGETLESSERVQDAVIAYEAALRALAKDPALNLQHVLGSIGAIGKRYSTPLPALDHLYSPAADRTLAEAESDPLLAVRLLIQIGNAYLKQPQEDPALNAYNQALARPEINNAPLLQAYTLSNRGAILRRQGDPGAATDSLEKALDLFAGHAAPIETRRTLALLAGIARDRQQTSQAETLYLRAINLYEEAQDNQGAARAYAGLGHSYLREGRFTQASAAYQNALQQAGQSGEREVLAEVHWGLGSCSKAAGDLNTAARHFRQSLDRVSAHQRELRTDEGKVSFLESVRHLFDELIGILLLLAEGDPSRSMEVLQAVDEAHGRALLDLMGGRVRRRPYRSQQVGLTRLMTLDEKLEAFEQQPTELADWLEGAEPPTQPGAFEDQPWRQMAPGIPIQSQMAFGVPSPGEMAPGIPAEGPALAAPVNRPPLPRLVFHVLPERTAVIVVSAGGAAAAHTAQISQAELAEQVGRLHRALGAGEAVGLRLAAPGPDRHFFSGPDDRAESVNLYPILQDLYNLLIEPLEGLLPPAGLPLVIEPHGPLWLLPFATLRSPQGLWLGDRWPLLYAPSGRALDEIRSEPDYGPPASLNALVLGNPLMPLSLNLEGRSLLLDPLPGAEAEARHVAALFPPERCELLLGAQASRRAVNDRAPQTGILHLATHGLASAADPLASLVVLADHEGDGGLLTAREAASLELPADLVALSACQTGLGRVSGDGILGLSRAFLAAGARAVLVSLWNVSDQATAALMEAFYKAYLAQDNKAHALQAAMQAVRSTSGWEHPRFWAPFVVIGAED